MRFIGLLRLSWMAVVLGVVAQSSLAQTADHELTLDLSPVLDLGHVFSETPESLEKEFSSEHFKENPFIRWNKDRSKATFLTQPFSNISVDLSILEGKVKLSEATIKFVEGKAILLTLASNAADEAALAKVREKVGALLGCAAGPAPKPLLGPKGDLGVKTEGWTSDKGVALMNFREGAFSVCIGKPGAAQASLSAPMAAKKDGEPQEGMPKIELFVRLDALILNPEVWNLTPDSFAAKVIQPGSTLKQTPYYKWTNTAREGVLLTRHVFSNTSTDLLMFDDAVNAEEAQIEFRNGKAGKVTVTLLTRGNGGEGAASKFENMFKTTGRALGALLKVAPTQTVPAGKSLIKTQGYLWSTPQMLALMEFNADAPKGKFEFLRLKLMPASGRAELMNLAGIGDTVTTKKKASLTSNVKKDAATGDIYLAGVPMIDQGQKGYCVSASCARLFNYLGVKCDQDEIAELVKNDAEKGTRPSDMYAALKKIDQQYKMKVKVVKLPFGYGLQGLRDTEIVRAQKGDLTKLMNENIGAGTPLLWAVRLPDTPVEVRTGLPGTTPMGKIQDPQSGGGHMRLIIGYNTKTNEVIFTDSWGAGHEIKRMAFRDADQMTQAVFTMQPEQ